MLLESFISILLFEVSIPPCPISQTNILLFLISYLLIGINIFLGDISTLILFFLVILLVTIDWVCFLKDL